MPSGKKPARERPEVEKRAITLRLPADLLARIVDEATADMAERETGRVYSPSATIERILRQYFETKPRRRRGK